MYKIIICLLLLCTSLAAEKTNPSFKFQINKNTILPKVKELEPEIKVVILNITQLADEKELNMVIRRPLCKTVEKQFYQTPLPVIKIPESSTHIDFVIAFKGYFLGEKVYIDWTSKNDKGTLALTPFPLNFKSGGITAQVELFDQINSMYTIKLNGYEPGEEVTMTSTAYHETITGKLKFTKDHPIIYLPSVVGYSEGFGELSFENETGKKLVMKLPFGKSIQTAREKGIFITP